MRGCLCLLAHDNEGLVMSFRPPNYGQLAPCDCVCHQIAEKEISLLEDMWRNA